MVPNYVNTDISIAVVDLLQEMTDVESDEDNEDSINAFFDALVGIRLVLQYISCL